MHVRVRVCVCVCVCVCVSLTTAGRTMSFNFQLVPPVCSFTVWCVTSGSERCHAQFSVIERFVIPFLLTVQWLLSGFGRSELGRCQQMQGCIFIHAGTVHTYICSRQIDSYFSSTYVHTHTHTHTHTSTC